MRTWYAVYGIADNFFGCVKFARYNVLSIKKNIIARLAQSYIYIQNVPWLAEPRFCIGDAMARSLFIMWSDKSLHNLL